MRETVGPPREPRRPVRCRVDNEIRYINDIDVCSETEVDLVEVVLERKGPHQIDVSRPARNRLIMLEPDHLNIV